MEVVAVEKIRIAMPEGPKNLKPGDRLSLPDRVGQRLLELAPGKVQVVKVLLFQIGQPVAYRAPVIQSPSQYTWRPHRGVVLAISAFAEMVCIQPENEAETTWRWLWWGYVEKVDSAR